MAGCLTDLAAELDGDADAWDRSALLERMMGGTHTAAATATTAKALAPTWSSRWRRPRRRAAAMLTRDAGSGGSVMDASRVMTELSSTDYTFQASSGARARRSAAKALAVWLLTVPSEQPSSLAVWSIGRP